MELSSLETEKEAILMRDMYKAGLKDSIEFRKELGLGR